MMGDVRHVKEGSATAAVVIALVVVGLAATLYFAHQHQQKQRALAYQRSLVAQRQAEEKRAAEAAAAAAAKAEEEAERMKAYEEAEARKKAQADAKKAVAARKVAEKKEKALRFEDAEQAFIESKVDMWTKGPKTGEPVWCLIPQEGGEGRIFEIVPGAGEAPATVRMLGDDGTVETMTDELFQMRFLNSEISWFVLRDGKSLLRASQRAENALKAQDKFSVPEEGRGYDIAEEIYGNAAKAVKGYKMTPPDIKWDVAFVTGKGVTVPVGQVGFGELVTREMFRPAAQKLLTAAAAKLQRERVAAEKKKVGVASTFQPSKKRTHFLYDKSSIKRSVDGLVYVPRQFKEAHRASMRGARQAQQDAERNAAHKAEWQALYDEAIRQEKAEAAERTAWEKARLRAATAKKTSDIPAIVVEPADVDRALDAGYFIYAPVGAAAGTADTAEPAAPAETGL